jgi:hypothetical protein
MRRDLLLSWRDTRRPWVGAPRMRGKRASRGRSLPRLRSRKRRNCFGEIAIVRIELVARGGHLRNCPDGDVGMRRLYVRIDQRHWSPCMEASWKPDSPGSDLQRPVGHPQRALRTGLRPYSTLNRLQLRLNGKEGVVGSSPTEGSRQKARSGQTGCCRCPLARNHRCRGDRDRRARSGHRRGHEDSGMPVRSRMQGSAISVPIAGHKQRQPQRRPCAASPRSGAEVRRVGA